MFDPTFANDLIHQLYLYDERAAERREKVINYLGRLPDRVQELIESPFERARDEVFECVPEAAADILAREAWIGRLVVGTVAGTVTMKHFEYSLESYLLCWRRAIGALRVRKLTCRTCGEVNPRVAIRRAPDKRHGIRVCLRCGKAADSRAESAHSGHRDHPDRRIVIT
jgi:hypothetical protein